MSTFSTYDATINSFYLAFYGRPADPAGMKYWSQQLANNSGDFGTIVDAFANSEEALTRFGNVSAADRITDIYAQLFNRAPDTDGMAYWMNAINKGQASMADVALSILRGARGSDATLSQLRQQAADAFTAEVVASGAQYDGYASIEAARVLVRAVTPSATQDDLDTLVKSAVSFADTATKTPKVVEAIAVNTTLLSLFDTARGTGDPVALAQALADTAKAAAGDPVTLESLLRGGGMEKVLKVMPAAATLKDVVAALGKGGLPAAVEVVYPTAPSATPSPDPIPVPLKTFIVDGHGHKLNISGTASDDVVVDLTNDIILRAGHQPIKNMTDITAVYVKDYAGKVTVTGTASEIELALLGADMGGVHAFGVIDKKNSIFSGEPGMRQFVSNVVEMVLNSAKSVTLIDTLSKEERALFDSLQGFDVTKLQGKVDNQAPRAPLVALDVDSGSFPTAEKDYVTNVGTYTVTAEDGATVQFSKNGLDNWTTTKPEAKSGNNAFFVRQIDKTGNIGEGVEFKFTLLTGKPAAPVLALDNDTGTKGDAISAVGDIRVSGLTPGFTMVEYRTSADGQWQLTPLVGDTDSIVIKVPGEGSKYIEVRQIDQAGNKGAVHTMSYVVDPNAPQGPLPKPSGLAAVGYELTGVPGALYLYSQSGPIKMSISDPSQAGFIDKSGFHLTNLATGSADTAATSGPSFGIPTDGMLRFGATIKAGMYSMSWEDRTIATADGYLSKGMSNFAGGINGQFLQQGFLLSFIPPETNSADNMLFSGAYIGRNLMEKHIATGGGQDAVFAEGADLTIEYRVIDSNAQDLIVGFGPGDEVLFTGNAAVRIDRDGLNGIQWADNSIAELTPTGNAWPKVAIDDTDEAVEIVVQGVVSSGMFGPSLQQTLATLNGALAMNENVPPDSLLILAKNDTGGAALLFFDNLDRDPSIDAGELSLIAMFSDSVLDQASIELIGSEMGIPVA